MNLNDKENQQDHKKRIKIKSKRNRLFEFDFVF